MADYQLIIGDCLESMRQMADKSVNCCVTSPPYYGLRDYGVTGQMGMEPTPDDFVQALVAVFSEVRRVLRDDGTVWLNLGDSYARAPAKGGSGPGGKNEKRWGYGDAQAAKANAGSSDGAVRRGEQPGRRIKPQGLADKQLIGIPWRVAFALQADGWYLRQDIIWSKPNPMPESVRDRCTKSHEYVFLLSKSPRYYYDHEAIKEPAAESSITRLAQPSLEAQAGSARVPGKTNGNMKAVGGEMRNRRSVWSVTTKPFKGAHFATFPPELIEPCILAGCPASGTGLDPFGGSGTTAAVALANDRNAIICELNPQYAALVKDRISAIAGHNYKLI